MDLLDTFLLTEFHHDHTWLNAVSLILGRILNSFMTGTLHTAYWRRMLGDLVSWQSTLPAHFAPFARTEPPPGENFSRVWMLRDCHGQ